MSKAAALLLNLGSPDSTSIPDVRRYLDEFLSDERVLDIPAWKRSLILKLFILPKRPKESAEAYSEVCCLLYTSPSPRDATLSRMPSSA